MIYDFICYEKTERYYIFILYDENMKVVKRNGESQPVDFEKVHWRVKSLCGYSNTLEFERRKRPEAYNISKNLTELKYATPDTITLKTFQGLYDGVPTTDIDVLSAEIAQDLCTDHPDNTTLAKRILVSNIQKNVQVTLLKQHSHMSPVQIKDNLFRFSMEALYSNINKKGEQAPLIAPYLMAIALKYVPRIEKMIDYSRDYTNHDYLGIKLLEKGYLFRTNLDGVDKNIIVETPQISDMRIDIVHLFLVLNIF